MTTSPDGRGFWLATTSGGIYTFGDAPYYGSAAGLEPSHPLVGMALTSGGHGYWLAFADGAVLGFGDAEVPFLGLSSPPSAPIVGLAADPGVHGGLWLLGTDGTVYPLGGAPRLGSTHAGSSPARAIAAMPDGAGYWVVDAIGSVSSFGDAAPHGNAS